MGEPEDVLDEEGAGYEAVPGEELPDPPVDTAEQRLPFDQLRWERFEDLCLKLAALQGTSQHTRRYGIRGQAQEGIDVYSRLNVGTYATYQCRRWQTITAADLKSAIDDFLAGEWAERSKRFTFCTSMQMLRTELAEAIETEGDRLAELEIEFEVWDAESLALKMKAHPGLVEDFFGKPWLERFSRPETAREAAEETRKPPEADTGVSGSTRLISLDWAAEKLQEELEQLQNDDEETFNQLVEATGTPPSPEMLDAVIEAPPRWLVEGNPKLWKVLAAMAEKIGAWPEAVKAWGAASRAIPGERVTLLCSGAAAAGVAEEPEIKERLLSEAREIDPNHPGVRLAEIDQSAPGKERLEQLADIETDDDETRTLLAAHRALAALLVPDIDLAKEQLALLKTISDGSIGARAIEINTTVQIGRLSVVNDRPIDAAALESAREEALKLRDELLERKRFEEAGRSLMLAADASSLLGERARASRLLEQADPAELGANEIAEVLASAAAGRALDFRLARKLLTHAADTDEKRLLEAEILEDIGNAEERARALATLEEIMAGDGRGAAEAAFLRAAATLGPRPTEWSQEAVKYLREHGHLKAAVNAEVFYLIGKKSDYSTAEELLRPHLDQQWAKVAWLRMEIQHGRWQEMKVAADAVLAEGASQQARLDAGRAYGKSHNLGRAKEVLITLAREHGAPTQIRSEAYRLLMVVVGEELGDWRLARKLHDEWVEIDPGNPNASAIAVRIANRLARRD